MGFSKVEVVFTALGGKLVWTDNHQIKGTKKPNPVDEFVVTVEDVRKMMQAR